MMSLEPNAQGAEKDSGYQPYFIQDGHAGPWRPWFAWRPVWVTDLRWPYRRQKRIWLRPVLRRKFYCASWFVTGGLWFWQFTEMDNYAP